MDVSYRPPLSVQGCEFKSDTCFQTLIPEKGKAPEAK